MASSTNGFEKLQGKNMKTRILLTLWMLLLLPQAYGDCSGKVLDVYTDPGYCCINNNYFKGLYIATDIGYSEFSFFLHRPPLFGLFVLNDGDMTQTGTSLVAALGYDFFSQKIAPMRLEYNYFYADRRYVINPVFPPDLATGIISNDEFIIHNNMITAYIDWHNCTRFIPFIGASYGWCKIRTHHFPHYLDTPTLVDIIDGTTTSNSWGWTVGSRFMFRKNIFANVQLRYNDLKSLRFKNYNENLPNNDDYLSDYLHEMTVLVGIGYQF